VGHRGSAGLAPENTVRAFAAGVESGVDAIEFDIVALTGGDLVVTHDEGLALLTLAAARERRPGLLTLDEALAWIAGSAPGIAVHADVKCPGREADIVGALARHGLLARALVSSNHAAGLRRFAVVAPLLPRALGYPHDRHGASGRPWLAPAVEAALVAMRCALPLRIPGLLRASSATVAALERRIVSGAVVRRCHALGVPVHVWTVDDPAEATRLARLGVDAIVSDRPDLLMATLPL
jgi:glycerophosphoryl diester phosphodiesterase